MYDCQCMYGPLSRPVPIYDIKPPKHVARTPLSANSPTILALPRITRAWCYLLLSIFYSSSFSSSLELPPPPPPSRRVHYLFSLLLLAVSPSRLPAPHCRDLQWFRTSRLIHNSLRLTRYPHSISSHHAYVVGASPPNQVMLHRLTVDLPSHCSFIS